MAGTIDRSCQLVVVTIIILTQLIKLPHSSAQWIQAGAPSSAHAGGTPGDLLERVKASYRNVANGGNYLPPPSSSSASHLHPPPAIFPGGGGGSYQAFPIGGASAAGTFNHLYDSQNFGSGSTVSSMPSNSKSISGDYCFEPLVSCDTTNTLLYCIQARCACPNQWTLSPGDLPLHTVWHPELRRCVSTVGSGCHVATGSYPFMPPAARLLPSSPGGGGGGAFHYEPSSSLSSSSPTKEIATTIIKGLIGLPSNPGEGSTTSGGMGYVHCQPGVNCVPHPGYQETGICSGSCLQTSLISGVTLLVISLYFNFVPN